MKYLFSLFFGSILLLGSITAQTVAFTLEQALAYGLENSNVLKIEQENILDAKGQTKEFVSIGVPKLELNSAYNYYAQLPVSLIPAEFVGGEEGDFEKIAFGTRNTFDVGLDGSVMLINGSYFVGLKATRVFQDLIKKQIVQTEVEIKYNVTLAYYNVLIIGESLKILNQNITVLEKNLNETQALYETGFVEQLDVDRLQFSLTNMQTQANTVERAIILGKNVLKFQMGYPMEGDILITDDARKLIGTSLVTTTDISTQVNYIQRPEYRTLLVSQELNEINVKQLKMSRIPTVYGFANHTEMIQRENLLQDNGVGWLPSTVIGASLQFDIFDGGERKGKVMQAQASLNQVDLRINEFERAMTMEVQNSKVQFINARNTALDRVKNMDLAQKIFDTSNIKYSEGVGSSVEVTQAERQLYTSQSDYINALLDLLQAKTELEKALGIL